MGSFITPYFPVGLPAKVGRQRSVLPGRCTWCMAASPSGKGQQRLDYATSGVNIDRESASVAALISNVKRRELNRSPGEPGALVPHPGGFSGLIEFGDSLLAMCTDGVGSKLLLAAHLDNYETVAEDCVAMNVNDLLCVGAEPLAFVDYIAAPSPSPEKWAAIGRSLGAACLRARVSLCGGETASLPDMVKEIDMSGTALGWLPRGAQIDGSKISPGDAIIGLPSSGLHSNGYSLARAVVSQSDCFLSSPVPFKLKEIDHARIWRHGRGEDGPVTLGEVLLNPTRIYVDPVVDLFKETRSLSSPCRYEDIHGLAHITGGGLSNLLRLQKGMGYHIFSPLPVHPEFEWLKDTGNITDLEMHKTFNMGMGMAIVVAQSAADSTVAWLREKGTFARVVGEVNGSGVVTHALPSVTFVSY